MKRKDDLLNLAFGEMTDDAAKALEARATAAEKAEIDALRDLKRGLQQLPSPPAGNLSNERLRAAILNGELRARRVQSPRGTWAWAPFALAALAGIVFLARPKPAPRSPWVAINQDSVSAGLPENPGFDALTAPLSKERAVPQPSVVKPMVAPVAEKVTEFRRPRRTRRRDVARLTVSPRVDEKPEGPLYAVKPTSGVPDAPFERQPETVATPPSTVVAATFDELPPTSEDTVVVVSSERDKDTGARAATEMEASNVVVGG